MPVPGSAASLPQPRSRRDAAVGPDLAQLRRWLRNLRTPYELDDPALVKLLGQHGRMPSNDAPLDVGQAAAQLLADAIERLRPAADSPRQDQMPYLVLKTCYVERRKRSAAGMHLNMSERTLTREATRALQLLQAELTKGTSLVPPAVNRSEPVPRISGFFGRDASLSELRELRHGNRLIHVSGPAGVGKTCLVAEHAAMVASHRPVVWYQLRHGLNDNLITFLLDLAGTLTGQLPAAPLQALKDSVTRHEPGLASRVALQALQDLEMLLVLDNYQLTEPDVSFNGFIEEATSRTAALDVITISRRQAQRRGSGAALHVPPFAMDETAAFLEQLRIEADHQLVGTVHEWTGGLPQLIKYSASWLKTATPAEIAEGARPLMEADDVQDFLLDSITELIDPEDRHILSAASVFRDRFTDDALAYVAERSRGQVLDTSRRLIRYYLATRALDGEVAFFHTSIRDYVHARLDPHERVQFHLRAAHCFERSKEPDEAAYHRQAVEGLSPA
jgi:ATP/maltotriose-dependent transcriptional regulator MalT